MEFCQGWIRLVEIFVRYFGLMTKGLSLVCYICFHTDKAVCVFLIKINFTQKGQEKYMWNSIAQSKVVRCFEHCSFPCMPFALVYTNISLSHTQKKSQRGSISQNILFPIACFASLYTVHYVNIVAESDI